MCSVKIGAGHEQLDSKQIGDSMAANQTIDIEQFKAQLKTFDALRDTDEIQTGTLPYIKPESADESLPKLHTSIQKALNNNRNRSTLPHIRLRLSVSPWMEQM